METETFFETSVTIYQTTRRHIPEDSSVKNKDLFTIQRCYNTGSVSLTITIFSE
jgi:hypothetical protein